MRNLLLVLLLTGLTAGCHHGMRSEIAGSGKRAMQKREVAPFTSIMTEGAFNIEVTCQKGPELEVEGDDNILDYVSTEVSNNVLRVKSTKGYSVNEPVKLKISAPNLEALSVSGAGRIDVKGMNNEKFVIDSNGAPSISVSGTTKTLNINTNGAGKIDTYRLHASRGIVESKGVSRVDLNVAEQLDVTVSGPSVVFYKGDPVVNKTIHGPGKVERRGDTGA
jgi:Putative auto-transporter adhesin, head GIN domain